MNHPTKPRCCNCDQGRARFCLCQDDTDDEPLYALEDLCSRWPLLGMVVIMAVVLGAYALSSALGGAA